MLNLQSGRAKHRYLDKPFRTLLGRHLENHYQTWLEETPGVHAGDLVLVTGTYMTQNWEAATYRKRSSSTSVDMSINAVCAIEGGVRLDWSTWTPGDRGFKLGHIHGETEINLPNPFETYSFKACCTTCQPPPENQCIFVWGWRIREMFDFFGYKLVRPVSVADIKEMKWRELPTLIKKTHSSQVPTQSSPPSSGGGQASQVSGKAVEVVELEGMPPVEQVRASSG